MPKKTFILDVDGILTDGGFFYDQAGQKCIKRFGPDDSDALKLIASDVDILFVSADKRGFLISSSRVNDLGFEIFNVSSAERLAWISERFVLSDVIYMGDGFYDAKILNSIFYGITTIDSCITCRISANYVTKTVGSFRAVSDAVLHLCLNFYPYLFQSYCELNNLSEDHILTLKNYLS